MSALLLAETFGDHMFRVAGTPEAPRFVAADACAALDIRNVSDTLNKRIPDDEKGIDPIYTLGGVQEMATLTEAGLYRLIFRSNKPEAERFRHWVFHEVLPAIRRQGRYVDPAAVPAEPPKLPAPLSLTDQLAVVQGVIHAAEVLGLEGRDRIDLKDCLLNIARKAAGLTVEQPEAEVTLSDRARQLGIKVSRKLLSLAGRKAAALYRERHGAEPVKRTQFVDGAPRQVNSYRASDLDLVDEALRTAEAGGDFSMPKRIDSPAGGQGCPA